MGMSLGRQWEAKRKFRRLVLVWAFERQLSAKDCCSQSGEAIVILKTQQGWGCDSMVE